MHLEIVMKSVKNPLKELIHHDVMDEVWCDNVIDNMLWWKISKTIHMADMINPIIITVDEALRYETR